MTSLLGLAENALADLSGDDSPPRAFLCFKQLKFFPLIDIDEINLSVFASINGADHSISTPTEKFHDLMKKGPFIFEIPYVKEYNLNFKVSFSYKKDEENFYKQLNKQNTTTNLGSKSIPFPAPPLDRYFGIGSDANAKANAQRKDKIFNLYVEKNRVREAEIRAQIIYQLFAT